MKFGFHLLRLRLTGGDRPNVDILFKSGLNVISGASNTGKSFIFQCIDFLLGAQTPPKAIPEAIGYSRAMLSIRTFDDRIFDLSRQLDGGPFTIIKSEIGAREEVFAEKHTSDRPNISTFLLEICGLRDVLLIKNANNQKVNLSFRNLAGFSLVDERTIISEQSPVFNSGEAVSKTREKSLFFFLLTGKDVKEVEEIEDPKIRKSKILGKIDYLKEQIFRTQGYLKEFGDIDLEELNKQLDSDYERLNFEYQRSIREIDNLRNKRSKMYANVERVETKLLFKKELADRFALLETHYKSDLQRMQFLEEGSLLIGQLSNTTCPICGTLITEDHIDHIHQTQIESDNLIGALRGESTTIDRKLTELTETLVEISREVKREKESIRKLQNLINSIDSTLQDSLNPVTKSLKVRLTEIFEKRRDIDRFDRLKSDLNYFYQQVNSLTSQLKEKTSVDSYYGNEEALALDEFAQISAIVLKSWSYPNLVDVRFDSSPKYFDIAINGSPRMSNGKGYRAITYSAFVLSLMIYCNNRSKPHPNFLILDSPLTTFKEQDHSSEGNSENVEDYVERSFFSYLADLNKDMQVIIFENKDPEKDIILKANYIHFSGKGEIGRKGFFSS